MTDRQDAAILRLAADVIRRRSKKPKGFWLDIQCRVLISVADAIERKVEAEVSHPDTR